MDPEPYKTSTPNQQANAIRGPYGTFRQNGTLRSLLVLWLMLDALLAVFFAILHASGKLDHSLTEREPSNIQQMLFALGNAQIAIRVLCYLFFAIWLYRACKNAWLLDAPRIQITPGWSIGYYFIPLLNLWKPYITMKQIRSASYASDRALGKLLPTWWTSWLGFLLLGAIIAIIKGSNDLNEQTQEIISKLNMIHVLVDIVLNLLAISLVLHITRAQNTRIAQWRV